MVMQKLYVIPKQITLLKKCWLLEENNMWMCGY